jgi:hypothetical protein
MNEMFFSSGSNKIIFIALNLLSHTHTHTDRHTTHAHNTHRHTNTHNTHRHTHTQHTQTHTHTPHTHTTHTRTHTYSAVLQGETNQSTFKTADVLIDAPYPINFVFDRASSM